jgi:quinoprotein relay system zinc metallohydrolase 2
MAAPLAVTEVASGIFVHQGVQAQSDAANGGDIANIGFVIGGDAVAIVDTGGTPAIGQALREAVRARTPAPIRYVINTHMHPDHVFGNAAFQQDHPVFIAHERFWPALVPRSNFYLHQLDAELGTAAAADARLFPPDRTVSDTGSLDLGGGRVLDLRAWPAAHTDNDLTVFDRRTGTLFTGDLVFAQRVPAIDGSGTGWLRALDDLAALPAVRAVPGHGPAVAPWPAVLEDERRYLSVLIADIRRIQHAGGTIEQASAEAAASERGRWLLFDDDNPRNAVSVFAELEWE